MLSDKAIEKGDSSLASVCLVCNSVKEGHSSPVNGLQLRMAFCSEQSSTTKLEIYDASCQNISCHGPLGSGDDEDNKLKKMDDTSASFRWSSSICDGSNLQTQPLLHRLFSITLCIDGISGNRNCFGLIRAGVENILSMQSMKEPIVNMMHTFYSEIRGSLSDVWFLKKS